MSFNGALLRLARVGQGLTQVDLAARIATTQSRVAKWEDSLSSPAPADLQRLSETLRFPEAFFVYEVRPEPFGSCCMYHRKRQSLPATLLNQIHARVNILRLGIDRLLKNVAMAAALEFPNMDIDEYQSASQIASLVRQQWRISHGPVPSLIDYVESAGGIVTQMDFQTDKLDAVSLWPRGSRPMFFINRSVPTDRWRWTLAHEVGHIVMHRVATPNAEQEADEFASEFLMPGLDIESDLKDMSLQKAARLKLKWRTSMQALIRRAHDTGAITPRKYRSLFTAMSAAKQRKVEPVTISPESPSTLEKLVEYHRKTLGYSDQQLRDLLFCLDGEQMERRYGATSSSKHRLRVVAD